MKTIQDLASLPCIYKGRHSLVYRHDSSDYGRPVVVKLPRNVHATPRDIARLTNEYKMTRDFAIPGARRACDSITIDGRPALILEYIEGKTVREMFVAERRPVAEILTTAISIAKILIDIHRLRIVHKNLTSSNILIRSDWTATLIDFAIASYIPHRNDHLHNFYVYEGSLPYISPEQTGRMNRSVDHRSDLYSFGVLLYEMLTGRLPFETTNTAELVHSHIAGSPTPIQELNPDVPQVVAEIVTKLMAKDAEDRYQSAHGLKADLEKILNRLTGEGRIEAFELAGQDFPDSSRLPHRFYGREQELDVLVKSLERVSEGASEVVLVSGQAGVGKSSLVGELRKYVVERGGYFIHGSHNEHQSNTPYSALIHAFTGLVDLFLTESTERLSQWETELVQAVGADGALLVEMVPRLELIMGRQPYVPELGGAEAQNRFHFAIQSFVQAIARKNRPLVLFIDNMQWVDQASLNLLSLLMGSLENSFFLFIGAYRDGEVGPSHPLTSTIEALKWKKATIETVHLENFTPDTLSKLLSDALNCEPFHVHGLAELIHEKTGGNGLFAIQFLQAISEAGLLVFDPGAGCWRWESDQIRAMNITGNVATLMTQKIEKLPVETQQFLSLAGCIGGSFDIGDLATIAQYPVEETWNYLQEAIDEGLVQPLEDNLQVTPVPEVSLPVGMNTCFEFVHDRVRKASCSILPKKHRKTVHLKIGRFHLEKAQGSGLEEKIFDIVDHYNEGFQYLEDEQEKLKLVELNLMAGRKAKRAAAYKSAIWYLSMGIGMLPPDRWELDYDLTLDLYMEAVEAEYLSSNTERAELLSTEVLQHVKDLEAKVRIYELRDNFHSTRNQASATAHKIGNFENGYGTFPVRENLTSLDTAAILRASHMLSQEIRLEQLLERLMHIVIQNAGAEKGILIEKRNGKLIVQAKGEIGQKQIRTMQEIPIEESGEVPVSIINYVARTQAYVVLDNAFQDSIYASDPYVTENMTRSLLCLPIVYQGRLTGLLYLENNLTTDAFTLDRLELLKALSTQAATSLENARLYASLEKKISDLQRAEEAFRLNAERLDTLLRLNQMTGATIREITEFVFEAAIRLTKSKVGYLAFLNEEETVLTMQLWSRTSMAQCEIADKPIHYPVETTGLWGEAVRQRRPIITNDFQAANPWKKGYPEGHVKLFRHMNAPVIVGNRIVLVAGVGNKEEDYDETDVQQLALLMEGMWRLIERHRAEQALRESEEFLNSIVENIPDMIFIKDAEELRFVRFNKAGEDLVGYPREQLIGKNDHDFFPADEADFYTRKDREVLATKHLVDIPEETIQTRNLGKRTLHTQKLPILDTEGNPRYLLGISEDITERKKAEEELVKHRDHLEDQVKERTAELIVAKEKAEAANQAKSAFLSSMSHELRTPLNAILGYAQILKRQKNLTEKQQQQLDTLRSSGEHLLTLINDILDVGKIEAQKMELKESVFELPRLLRQVFDIARLKGEEKDLCFEYEALSPLPELVKGDERKLKQILLNLLSNAVKYTRRGGVTLRVSYDGTGTGLFHCEVIDTGIGIPEEKRDDIFEPFVQLAANGLVREGTGLGLTITRKLVTLMGGSLGVESEPGKGSIFRVELNLAEAVGENIPAEQVEYAVIGYKGRRKKILIVDDNITNISMLVSLLEPLGFEVLTAESGKEGIQQALERKPDLILLDLVMPGMDGLEVAKRLRAHRELAETRILGISATVSDSDRKRAFEEACDGFLGKPIRTSLLFQKMHEMLGLEWEREPEAVSEAAPPPKQEETMRMPPREEMKELLDLARMGDVRNLGVWASKLEEKNSEYGPFARKLRKLAGDYKLNAILALVEQHMENSGL